MMCYRDATFCDFSECAKFDVCPMAYNDEVKEGARRWMGDDAVVILLADKPKCFEEKNET